MKDYIITILLGIIFLMAYWIDCQRRFIRVLKEYREKDHEYEEYQRQVIYDLLKIKP